MITPIVLDGLLFTEDEEILPIMNDAMTTFVIDATVTLSSGEIPALLDRLSFDALLIDFKSKEVGSSAVRFARDSKLNHQTLIVAITDESEALKIAFGLGVRLSMPRPKTAEEAIQGLKPSYAFLLRQREKTLRFDTSIPVKLTMKDGSSMDGMITNLSEAGAGLLVTQEVLKGDIAHFEFQPPTSKLVIRASGQVVWSGQGKAGIAFSILPQTEQVVLRDWVADRIRLSNAGHPVLTRRAAVPAFGQKSA